MRGVCEKFFSTTVSRRYFQFSGLAFAGFGISGCWGSTYLWNEKLTLVVQTPRGEVTASSVVSASYTYGQMPMSGNDISGGYSGEAVVMKISNTKYLFALMNIGSTEEYHRTLLTFGIKIPNSREAALVEISKLRGSKVIPWGLYPILVTFTDIKKPESIKQVMPNDLARHFGTGYTLTAITLAITDQNMTEGYVEAVLPWIKTLKGSIGKDMALPQKHFLNKIYSGSFWQRTK